MLQYILTKIKAKRLERNISQSYMATQLNLSQSYYNRIENGKYEMSARIMFQVIEILDIDIVELFGSTPVLRKV